MFVPLALAYLLTSRHLWGKPIFRTAVLPAGDRAVHRLGLRVAGLPERHDRLVQPAAGAVGIDAPDWLNSSTWVLPSLDLIAVWGIGNAIIIYMAALRSVPVDLYEAARLDGAGPWRCSATSPGR